MKEEDVLPGFMEAAKRIDRARVAQDIASYMNNLTATGERFRVVKALDYWQVIDTKQFIPPCATYHQDCLDAEKMAKSLASWLNSGPEA